MTAISIRLAGLVLSTLFFAGPATAGAISITQAKANAGNITPGDAAGFPITLTLPGSYRFDTDIEVPASKNGIIIKSPDITIDLNGFRLGGGHVAANAIAGPADRLTIRNGTITAFQKAAILNDADFLIVENMRIVGNVQDGIRAHGSAHISDSTISNNGYGILCAGGSCLVEGDVISGNGGAGVYLISGTILGNTIASNAGLGIFGSTVNVGYGNNTIFGNNGGDSHQQVEGARELLPNVCSHCAD